MFGALRTRPAVFVFFLAKSPSKGSTEAYPCSASEDRRCGQRAPPRPCRPPARGQEHKGARALPLSLRSRYSAASSRISREFSSILRPACARPRAPGRRRPLPGLLRPAPLAARPVRPAAPLPGLPRTPRALGRHPPLRALKLTLKGERRSTQPMEVDTPAPGAGIGLVRGQSEPAELLGPGPEC